MITVKTDDQSPHFWLVDTRNIWHGTSIADSAPEALVLLNSAELTKALGFHFLKDAKMSVASSLLKRFFVTKTIPNIPWHEIRFTRRGDPRHGKPCWLVPRATNDAPSAGKQLTPDLDFNVSHQAGLVALAGCLASTGSIGIDIVCVNERNERATMERDGFDHFVDMHAEVFSDADLASIKSVTNARGEGNAELEHRMRRFYAFWCLKEAYVKLEGEALLAKWLRSVEFRGVRVPRAAAAGGEGWGEVVGGIEVWRGGRRVQRVRVWLQAFERDYMLGTVVAVGKGGTVDWEGEAEAVVPVWRLLDVERDVYPLAAKDRQTTKELA